MNPLKNLIFFMFKHHQKTHELLKEILTILNEVSRKLSKYSETKVIDTNLSDESSLFFVPPGHFYSPVPSNEDIAKWQNLQVRQEKEKILEIPGIDLKTHQQMNLLSLLQEFYEDLPFTAQKQLDLRFFYENPAYSYSDSIFLYFMIRHFQPNHIIEVGSGYSSCAMLDINEIYFNGSIKTTFIEPYPDLLFSLIKEQDKPHIDIHCKKLQEIELSLFSNLNENDILFIDSTHILKLNSDVNYIFSSILPCLQKGVLIHFHDIFYPFEYPEAWIRENRAWNEIYTLRSFLQYNNSFEIIIFNTYLEYLYPNFFEANMPLCLKNPGGSIWIRKTQ